MPKSSPNLALSEYHFTFIASDSIKIPSFPGKLLHGAFGNALHRNVCTTPTVECKNCFNIKNCAYTYLFKCDHQLHSGSIQNIETLPPPYVFRFDNQYSLSISSLHQFQIKFLLFGIANQRAEDVILAMQALGERGVSEKKAKLNTIEQYNWGGLSKHISTPADIVPPKMPSIPNNPPKKIKIHFITPYIASGRMQNTAFDIGLWLMGIIRRLALLQSTYSNTELEVDFSRLKYLTEMIKPSNSQLYFYETPKTKKNYTSGLLGSIDISLVDIEELWPWLFLGQWINGGKKTSYGFGRYSLLLID